MKTLKLFIAILSLAFFASCSHLGASDHSCCKSKTHECQDGKCKKDKSCCDDQCKKCDGKSSCQDGSCDLKKKK